MNPILDNPTPYLRFVERDGERVLQQWWVHRHMESHGLYAPARGWAGEWRDVPLEKE